MGTQIVTGTASAKSRGLFEIVFVALVLIGNLLLLEAAWRDKGWGALGAAIFVGPILNGAFLVSGLVATPFLKRRRPQFSLGGHLALTIALPVVAVTADYFTIMSMGLHGC